MKNTYTIRYRKDGNGWWYEVRDAKRVLVSSAWRAGECQHAKDEARSVVQNLERQASAA